MQTCIQMDVMAKRKLKGKEERNLYSANISIRLSDDEAVRWYKVFDSAEKKYARVGNTDVMRELLGLDPPYLLTKDEIYYFQSGANSLPQQELTKTDEKLPDSVATIGDKNDTKTEQKDVA